MRVINRRWALAAMAGAYSCSRQPKITVPLKDGPVDRLPPEYRDLVRNTIETGKLPVPRLITVLHGRSTAAPPFALRRPVGIVVLERQPEFVWDALAGAKQYFVRVINDVNDTVASSPAIQATRWTSDAPLEYGGTFLWEVTAVFDKNKRVVSPGPEANPARFRVLQETLQKQLGEAEKNFGSSHLFMASLYTQRGVLEKAEQELNALEAANPGQELVKRLRASLK